MFSKQQIRAQLFTFLFAGFETTSTAIESLLFHLNSIQGVSRVISPITLKKMPITTAFIKETVRLATILDIIIPRKVTVDIKLPNGEIMPAGTQWTIDIQRMGQVRT